MVGAVGYNSMPMWQQLSYVRGAQHVDPDMAQSAVRGHEQEHVTRERAEAEREGRKVVPPSM